MAYLDQHHWATAFGQSGHSRERLWPVRACCESQLSAPKSVCKVAGYALAKGSGSVQVAGRVGRAGDRATTRNNLCHRVQ
jgi:hypothetical protein